MNNRRRTGRDCHRCLFQGFKILQVVKGWNRYVINYSFSDYITRTDMACAGVALVVSHDRWFLDRICTHIIVFEGDDDGKVRQRFTTASREVWDVEEVTIIPSLRGEAERRRSNPLVVWEIASGKEQERPRNDIIGNWSDYETMLMEKFGKDLQPQRLKYRTMKR